MEAKKKLIEIEERFVEAMCQAKEEYKTLDDFAV